VSLCSFRFTFTGTGEALIEKFRSHFARAGGTLSGSEVEGSFVLPTPVGQFKGSYSVSGQTIAIDVSDKPAFVPCGLVEARLSQFVKDG
jgi:hypothetical protein